MATLYLIGSGTPTPTKERHGTCHILDLDGDLLMFDCGPASTHKLVQAGLWPTRIERLFFTHHHFDHNADYPCFLLCRWDQSTGKEAQLKVWGPPPTSLITERLIGPQGAFFFDWRARVNHPCSQSVHCNRGGALPRPHPNVQVTDIGAGPVVATERWRVTAGLVRHMEPWLNSLAYRVDTPKLSIVFAGDTEPCETLTRLAAGCDVLVANCWDTQDRMDTNGEGRSQTGTHDAARMATESGAKMLVLTHTGAHLASAPIRDKALREIAQRYKGEIVFGEELKITRLDGFGSVVDRSKLADAMAGRVFLQGGPEPWLIRTGPRAAIVKECISYIRTTGRAGGFVLTPGGGGAPGTPVEHFAWMVEASKEA